MIVLTFLVALSVGEGRAQEPPEHRDVHDQIAEERAILPGMVFDLFYAVKDSLDYGQFDAEHPPEADLLDYQRVTPELMAKFEVDWRVESYRAMGNNYELIVVSRTSSEIRYRATRNRRYEWNDGEWRDLGGYVHL